MEVKMTKKEQLMEVFSDSEEYGLDYVAVGVKTDTNPNIEIIINPYTNFESKKEYYQNAYDDDLVLKTSSGIRIVSALGFDHDIEWADVVWGLSDWFY
jgi:hypothetical protein